MRPMGPVLAVLLLAGTLAAAAPAAAQEDGEVLYEILDDRGDVEPSVLGVGIGSPASAPASPATDPFDITAFRILEDEPDRLVLGLEVADIDAAGATLRDSIFGGLGGTRYQINFALAGVDVQYEIRPYFTGSTGDCDTALVADCDHVTVPMLCIQTNQSSCYRQAAYAEIRFEQNLYVFHVPKASLLGRGPADQFFSSSAEPPAALPKNLPAGATLQDWYAEITTLTYFDQAPDAGQGEAYRLATPSANTRVAVILDTEDEEQVYYDPYASVYDVGDGVPSVGAAPGVPTVVPLQVENLADGKRLVNLTVDFIAGEEAKWSAQIVPTLAIPDGDSRTVNLIINASERVEHAEKATLLVRGDALGHPDEVGVLRLHVEGAVPPSPEQPRLFFHAAGGQSLEESIFFGGVQTWLNTRPDDPAATSDADGFNGQIQFPVFGSQWDAYFPLDTPLAQDLVFDTDKPVEANVIFSSQVAFRAEVTLRLFAGGVFLGAASAPADIGTSPTEIPLSFVMAEENRRVAASEGRLEAYLEVQSAETGKGGVLDTFLMHPDGSFIDLPLVEDPNATPLAVSLGPIRISLEYKGDGEPEEFVNPNRTKLYRVVLVNEGVGTETTRLNLTFVDDAGWQVAVAPSLKYKLSPGESVTFGVFVTAPSNATEGDQFHVRLAAESVKDNVTRAQLMLITIATEGVDIPDESDAFHADNDTLAKAVREDGGKSPGLGLAALVGVIGLAVAWRRRRDTS